MRSQSGIDHEKHSAYVRSIESDKLLAEGRVAEARQAMSEAAQLDATYAIRFEFLGKADSRRVQVAGTIRRVLIPYLVRAGFAVKGGGTWSDGSFMSRAVGDVDQSILFGRDKFGHRLSVLLARVRAGECAEYYDWRAVGIRSGALAYQTQLELEAVCARWCELIEKYGLPWLNADIGGACRPTRR